MPLSVDGLVAVSSLAMLRSARAGATTGRLARVGLILGVLATIGANVTKRPGAWCHRRCHRLLSSSGVHCLGRYRYWHGAAQACQDSGNPCADQAGTCQSWPE